MRFLDNFSQLQLIEDIEECSNEFPPNFFNFLRKRVVFTFEYFKVNVRNNTIVKYIYIYI